MDLLTPEEVLILESAVEGVQASASRRGESAVSRRHLRALRSELHRHEATKARPKKAVD